MICFSKEFAKGLAFPQDLVLNESLVIDVLRGDVHEGKIAGALAGEDIFIGDGIHMLLYIAAEKL